jgi:hypothetical protein
MQVPICPKMGITFMYLALIGGESENKLLFSALQEG